MISEDRSAFVSAFEPALEQQMSAISGHAPELDEAVRYSLLGGGKRLRPMLMGAAFEAYSGCAWQDDTLAPSFMAALEMIHAYSLIHDDLPAMDNDDLRHGKATSHIAFGEDIAILAGDALLNGAFELMTEAMTAVADDSRRLAQAAMAMRTVAACSGGRGMIAGQVRDIKGTNGEMIAYIDMYEKKTGALLVAALVSGALLGGAPAEDQKILSRVAMQVGVAFQLQDDLLDMTGDEAVTGKKADSDADREQVSYARVLGVVQTRNDVAWYISEALAGLKRLTADTSVIANIIEGLSGRKA